MHTRRAVAIGAPRLALADIDALARATAAAELSPAARDRLTQSYAFVQRLARSQTPVYGLTTGCGPLAGNRISPEQREAFQRNLVRSHAVTLGAPHPRAFVRAGMAVRAHVLARGYSGVDPAAVDVLVAMLNRGVHPVVREVGGVGASGDLVELAQVALAVMGEGEVELDGTVISAAEGLRHTGAGPLVPRFREGLALMNGTSFHTGAAAVLVARARRIIDAALVAAAMAFDALRGNREALDPAFHAVRAHPGQRVATERLAALLRDSTLARGGVPPADRQDAYTLRCTPQVLGPVLDAVQAAHAIVETEIDAVSDNPIFLVEEERAVHGGNFHGQPVALALDQLKTALVEVGVTSERRLARLLDAQLNGGLPPFLIRDSAGVRNGFMGLQYCAGAMAADNAVLAAPASVRSVPTNANNQDVVSMGMVAARQARQVADNAERMVAIELLAAAQALELAGLDRAGAGCRAAHALIRTHAAPLVDDRPLRAEVDAVCRLIDDAALTTATDAAVAPG